MLIQDEMTINLTEEQKEEVIANFLTPPKSGMNKNCDIFELSEKRPYHRYIRFPVEIKTETEIKQKTPASDAIDWLSKNASKSRWDAMAQFYSYGINGSGNITVMADPTVIAGSGQLMTQQPMAVGGSGLLNIKRINSQQASVTGLTGSSTNSPVRDDEMSQGSKVMPCVCAMDIIMKSGCQCGGI